MQKKLFCQKIFFCTFEASKKTDMFVKDFISDMDIFDGNTVSVSADEYTSDNTAAMSMPGGIIVLEVNIYDYSMAQIGRIVEDNDAKIWSSSVALSGDSAKMQVTLKINQTDLSSIIRSFQRYGYSIKASYQGKNRNDDIVRNHYEQLMLYLNV